jgi:hypothetical protein
MSTNHLLLNQKIKILESQNMIMKMLITRKGFNAFMIHLCGNFLLLRALIIVMVVSSIYDLDL